MRSILVYFLTALLAVPTIVAAQSKIPALDQDGRLGEIGRAAHKKAVERFDQADTDKDGRLSRTEVAAHSDYLATRFDQMDTDGDDALSWEEFIGHDRWKKE